MSNKNSHGMRLGVNIIHATHTHFHANKFACTNIKQTRHTDQSQDFYWVFVVQDPLCHVAILNNCSVVIYIHGWFGWGGEGAGFCTCLKTWSY